MHKDIAQALTAQRAATLTLLRCLDEQAWDRPCLPPWRVRDVVAHLATIDEGVVTGRLLPVLRAPTRAELERWNDVAVARLAGMEADELLELLERWGTRLQRVVNRLPRLVARLPLRTVFGRQPLQVLLCRRIVDEWVHTVDIARATSAEAALPQGVADTLATGVLDTLSTLTLPHLEERAGVVRLVVGTGAREDPHGPRRTWSIDFARRQYGPRVTARPDATVRLHASVLALLTEGRPGWPGADAVVEGDETLAGRLLERLRV